MILVDKIAIESPSRQINTTVVNTNEFISIVPNYIDASLLNGSTTFQVRNNSTQVVNITNILNSTGLVLQYDNLTLQPNEFKTFTILLDDSVQFLDKNIIFEFDSDITQENLFSLFVSKAKLIPNFYSANYSHDISFMTEQYKSISGKILTSLLKQEPKIDFSVSYNINKATSSDLLNYLNKNLERFFFIPTLYNMRSITSIVGNIVNFDNSYFIKRGSIILFNDENDYDIFNINVFGENFLTLSKEPTKEYLYVAELVICYIKDAPVITSFKDFENIVLNFRSVFDIVRSNLTLDLDYIDSIPIFNRFINGETESYNFQKEIDIIDKHTVADLYTSEQKSQKITQASFILENQNSLIEFEQFFYNQKNNVNPFLFFTGSNDFILNMLPDDILSDYILVNSKNLDLISDYVKFLGIIFKDGYVHYSSVKEIYPEDEFTYAIKLNSGFPGIRKVKDIKLINKLLKTNLINNSISYAYSDGVYMTQIETIENILWIKI